MHHSRRSVNYMIDAPRVELPRPSRSLSPSPARNAIISPPLIRCSSDCRTISLSPSPPERSPQGPFERSMSIVTSPRSPLMLLPSLTLPQVATVRKSWKHVNTKGLNSVIRRCFHRLEVSCPAASGAFNSANSLSTSACPVRTVAEHTKFLMALLDRIVGNADQDIVLELRRIGACHASLREQFGFREEDLERFGEILAEALLKLDGIKQSKETSRAWRHLIASMIDHMRVGFDSEWRMQRRRSSFNSLSSTPDQDVRRNSTGKRESTVSITVTADGSASMKSHYEYE